MARIVCERCYIRVHTDAAVMAVPCYAEKGEAGAECVECLGICGREAEGEPVFVLRVHERYQSLTFASVSGARREREMWYGGMATELRRYTNRTDWMRGERGRFEVLDVSGPIRRDPNYAK